MLDEVRVVSARAENNIPLRKKEEPPLPPPHREGRPRDEQEGTSASHGQGLIRAPPCWPPDFRISTLKGRKLHFSVKLPGPIWFFVAILADRHQYWS